jgi:predicted ribosome quality control (RQC) complex YloA/Tae2 family protein
MQATPLELALQCPLQKNKRCNIKRKYTRKEKERTRSLEDELAALKAEKKKRKRGHYTYSQYYWIQSRCSRYEFTGGRSIHSAATKDVSS